MQGRLPRQLLWRLLSYLPEESLEQFLEVSSSINLLLNTQHNGRDKHDLAQLIKSTDDDRLPRELSHLKLDKDHHSVASIDLRLTARKFGNLINCGNLPKGKGIFVLYDTNYQIQGENTFSDNPFLDILPLSVPPSLDGLTEKERQITNKPIRSYKTVKCVTVLKMGVMAIYCHTYPEKILILHYYTNKQYMLEYSNYVQQSKINNMITLSGDLFASSSVNGIIKIWNWVTRKCLHTLEGPSSYVKSLFVSEADNLLISVYDGIPNDGEIKIWNYLTGKCHFTFSSPHFIGFNKTAFLLNDSDRVISLFRNTFNIINIKTGEIEKYLAGNNKYRLVDFAFSADNRLFVSFDDYGVGLWDYQSGEFLSFIACKTTPILVSLLLKRQLLVAGKDKLMTFDIDSLNNSFVSPIASYDAWTVFASAGSRNKVVMISSYEKKLLMIDEDAFQSISSQLPKYGGEVPKYKVTDDINLTSYYVLKFGKKELCLLSSNDSLKNEIKLAPDSKTLNFSEKESLNPLVLRFATEFIMRMVCLGSMTISLTLSNAILFSEYKAHQMTNEKCGVALDLKENQKVTLSGLTLKFSNNVDDNTILAIQRKFETEGFKVLSKDKEIKVIESSETKLISYLMKLYDERPRPFRSNYTRQWNNSMSG